MRRITLWALSTLTILVLLFSYHTSTGGSGTATAAATTVRAPAVAGSDVGSGDSGSGDSGSSDSGSSDSGASDSGASGSASSDSGASGSSTTYTGESVETRWGPVQVRITVVDGSITAVEAVVYPDGNHEDREINSYALPALAQEAVEAQSADIDMVSGATVTSEGYLQSLQSAIDQAHL